MAGYLWDYDKKELEKTKSGRIKILERQINYGPDKGEKISLSEVKKHWDKLNLELHAKQLYELLIWGEVKSHKTSQKNNEPYSMLF